MRHGKRALIALIPVLAFAALPGCGMDSSDHADDAGPVDGATGPGDDGDGGDGGTTADGGTPPNGETGRMIGMTEAHNHYRQMVRTATPIPDLVWTTGIAAVAQAYSEKLAANGCNLTHSQGAYGENLYWQSGLTVTPADVVRGWYDEVSCYTYGAFMQSDNCDQTCVEAMYSSGCGHYTQVVWRDTLRLGCGMATCPSGAEIWTCNYDPPGNYIGHMPY